MGTAIMIFIVCAVLTLLGGASIFVAGPSGPPSVGMAAFAIFCTWRIAR